MDIFCTINRHMLVNEILTELKDNPEPFSVVSMDNDCAEIAADSIGLTLYLTRSLGPGGNDDMITLEFSVNGRYNMTGKGNAFKVLSTVMAMIRQQLPRFVKPTDNYVAFTSDAAESSRTSLYRRAVPQITGLLHTLDYAWHIDTDADKYGYSASSVPFVWTREK